VHSTRFVCSRATAAAPLLHLSRALEAWEEYSLLMQHPEPDLLRGAVLIARHRHPLIQFDDVRDQIDDLAEQLQPRLPAGRYPLRVAAAIGAHLHGDRGFKGDTADYYNPANFCVDEVLSRRRGSPLLLGLLWMEVAARCGFPLYGCNVPGHFLLTPADPELQFFVDPFDGGRVAVLDEAEATLSRILGSRVALDPGFLTRTAPLPARTVLARMLNNLRSVYIARGNTTGLYAVLRYLRATRPEDAAHVRDAGFALWRMRRYGECAAALREYLARAPADAEDAPAVRRLLRVLRDVDIDDDDAPTDR
jgi:regulator of sirC expression with transglutaminase-like and TPR domain